jgi:hypothetical protein
MCLTGHDTCKPSWLTAEVERGAVFHGEGGEHAVSVEELFVLHVIE